MGAFGGFLNVSDGDARREKAFALQLCPPLLKCIFEPQ